jgi:uncharacterized protein YjbJ (UPF0337 family)
MANSGMADQVKGAAKETWGNAKDAVNENAEAHKRESEMRTNQARENLSEKVQDTKDRVNEKIDEHRRSA